MAVGCGLSVANIYYSQPLLADMGRYFGVSDRRMGLVSMLSQVGYATGMLLFVPLVQVSHILGTFRERPGGCICRQRTDRDAMNEVGTKPRAVFIPCD